MIKKVNIKNFQKHKNLELEFKPGLNIIAGNSNRGKSSIIRSIRWNIKNSPSGFGFRSWFATVDQNTSVEIELDNGTIKRERGNKTNEYLLNGLKLEAMRSEVPSEVSSLYNIENSNIQMQLDSYFLLQDSPGEVAKKLNDLVGLEIIDFSLKNINSIISKSKLKNEELTERKNQIIEELEKYKNLDLIIKLINEIEELELKEDRIESNIQELSDSILKLENFDIYLKDKKDFKHIERKISRIEKLIEEYLDHEYSMDSLSSSIKDIDINVEDKSKVVTDSLIYISSIDKDIDKHISIEKSISLINEFISLSTYYNNKEKELSKITKEYLTLKKKTKAECPTCGSELSQERFEALINENSNLW